ncbi:MAG: phosphodiesterase [Mycobacterium sp.]|uniref:phosphodiesterase n=1 Tax=Mycobacterium sp. TaxID=1785 RepID=UPI001EB1FD58|nr:phosphodiesterase [Mycobacterium sp.]MBW0018571.1 phosphodiesterase [Mycobacterium sp.]
METSNLVASVFKVGSAVRRRRIFHPVGVHATGSIERVAPASEGLPIPSSGVVARLSKAVGTPGAWPDAIGLAVRVTTHDAAAWDILLVSAGSGVLTRAIGLRPVTSWTDHALTTLMPLRYRGENWWLRARISTAIGGSGLAVDNLREHIAGQPIDVVVDQACGASPFSPLARLTLTEAVDPRPGDLSFDPTLNTAAGVELYPRWLTRLRSSAYDGSREGRPPN